MDLRLRSYKGKRPQLGKRAYVDPCATLVGDIQLGDDASIWPMVAARGDVNHIRIGARSNIQDGTVVHLSHGAPTIIGDDVTVGHGAILHGCTLEDKSFVGMGSTLLDGAVVESGAMLGAGALLTQGKRVPSGQLWGGSPAHYLRDLRPEEIENFAPHAWKYVELSREYSAEAVV